MKDNGEAERKNARLAPTAEEKGIRRGMARRGVHRGPQGARDNGPEVPCGGGGCDERRRHGEGEQWRSQQSARAHSPGN